MSANDFFWIVFSPVVIFSVNSKSLYFVTLCLSCVAYVGVTSSPKFFIFLTKLKKYGGGPDVVATSFATSVATFLPPKPTPV